MLKINVLDQARAFLQTLPKKHEQQINKKILLLAENPKPPRSKLLEGFTPLRRTRSGKYRIVYFVEGATLKISLIDKRNDDGVYREVGKKFK